MNPDQPSPVEFNSIKPSIIDHPRQNYLWAETINQTLLSATRAIAEQYSGKNIPEINNQLQQASQILYDLANNPNNLLFTSEILKDGGKKLILQDRETSENKLVIKLEKGKIKFWVDKESLQKGNNLYFVAKIERRDNKVILSIKSHRGSKVNPQEIVSSSIQRESLDRMKGYFLEIWNKTHDITRRRNLRNNS